MDSIKKSKLAAYLDTHTRLNDELPLVHTTEGRLLQEIAANDGLNPKNCPIYKEPLIYLFYGRPSYRISGSNTPDTELDLYPVCFIFKPNFRHLSPCRILPFDSGAMVKGIFEPTIKRDSTNLFELTPIIESARRLSNLLFETNRSYFLGRVKSEFLLPSGQEELKNIYKLLSNRGKTKYDDRRSAIEIQSKDPIDFVDNLLAVILPTSFLECLSIRKKILSEWCSYPITYSSFYGSVPSEYQGVIRDRLEGYLMRGGYL